jgi:hypothetical protein
MCTTGPNNKCKFLAMSAMIFVSFFLNTVCVPYFNLKLKNKRTDTVDNNVLPRGVM